jgi:hypothetical protein
MTAYRPKGAQVTGKNQQALRQRGQAEWHPDGCECRKCRRARQARAGRQTPRYGQQA